MCFNFLDSLRLKKNTRIVDLWGESEYYFLMEIL